jgi:hypothetical protein
MMERRRRGDDVGTDSRIQLTRLEQTGWLRGGYVASKATAAHPKADYHRALQATDVERGGTIDWDRLRFVAAVSDGDRYGIRSGDVLLPLRSSRTTAVVATGVPSGVIAVGHWAILTPSPEVADSQFLGWYLNHPATVVRIASLMRGTKIQFLSLRDLRSFELELPPLEVQRQFARVHALHDRVANLEQTLTQARRRYLDAVTMEALHGHLHTHHEQA